MLNESRDEGANEGEDSLLNVRVLVFRLRQVLTLETWSTSVLN